MTQDKSNYRISRWENIFGADLWIVRTLARRIIALLIGLIPVKRWRIVVRDLIDAWLIKTNDSKIRYFVGQYPKVRTEEETIRQIIENNLSIARFGDGEFNMCIGRHKSFQKQDTQLVTQLKSILKSKPENLLIGINTISSTSDLTVIWKKFVIRRGNRVLDLLDRTRTYDSSTITTVFPTDPIEFNNHVSLLKQIWDNRKVLFVVGRNSRFFFEEELFHNIAHHEFVYGPPKNAFDHYEELLDQVLSYDKDWLIMIALGPTATIMAADLCTKGYQAIDLGQTPSKYHLAKYGNRYPSSHPMYNNHQ